MKILEKGERERDREFKSKRQCMKCNIQYMWWKLGWFYGSINMENRIFAN